MHTFSRIAFVYKNSSSWIWSIFVLKNIYLSRGFQCNLQFVASLYTKRYSDVVFVKNCCFFYFLSREFLAKYAHKNSILKREILARIALKGLNMCLLNKYKKQNTLHILGEKQHWQIFDCEKKNTAWMLLLLTYYSYINVCLDLKHIISQETIFVPLPVW